MSDAIAAARYKLVNNANLIAAIPAASIYAGITPPNATAPCIGISSISTVQRNTVSMNSATYYATERVQVTVYAKTYPLQKSYMALVRAALGNANGVINGVTCDSIVPAGDGPDIFDDVLVIYEQSQDFMISYSR